MDNKTFEMLHVQSGNVITINERQPFNPSSVVPFISIYYPKSQVTMYFDKQKARQASEDILASNGGDDGGHSYSEEEEEE